MFAIYPQFGYRLNKGNREDTMRYRIGSVIQFRVNNEIVTLEVNEKCEDIKNGLPGFGGVSENKSRWGYDYQILKVIRY